MADLRQRFRTLDGMPAPELWGEVLTRAEREATPTRPSVRLTAWRDAVDGGGTRRGIVMRLLVILVLAMLLVASLALFAGQQQRSGGSIPLVFTVGGPLSPGGEGQVFAIDPDDSSPDATPRLVHESYAQRIHVSPDGRHALFEGLELKEDLEPGAGLVLARTDGSSARMLHDPGNYELGREFESIWAPDSHGVAWLSWIEGRSGTSQPSLVVADVDGGEPRRFVAPPAEDPHLIWSPDSVHVAYVEWGCESTVRHLYVLDTVTGVRREIGENLTLPSLPGWAHDGRRLAVLVVTGDVVPASSPDEDTLTCASRTGPNELILGDSVTGKVRTLATDVDAYNLAWSVDDRTIMWTSTSPSATDGVSVWGVPADGGAVAELVSLPVGADGVWSPDATAVTWVAWDGGPEETSSLWVVDLAGGEPRLVAGEVAGSWQGIWPKWSPDGEWIAFLRETLPGSSSQSVWIVRPDGRDERLIVDASLGVGDVDW